MKKIAMGLAAAAVFAVSAAGGADAHQLHPAKIVSIEKEEGAGGAVRFKVAFDLACNERFKEVVSPEIGPDVPGWSHIAVGVLVEKDTEHMCLAEPRRMEAPLALPEIAGEYKFHAIQPR